MILSIESSCDDSSIAVTRIQNKKLVFHQKISQDNEHTPYGGVVPEIASRLHAVALPKILYACRDFLPHLKAVAVTSTPGLGITLLEGVAMAQALALALKIPLIAVHHLKGHIYSLFIEQDSCFPLDVLLVSGGHTLILQAISHEEVRIVAQSLDDSFGESFDKVAKMLGLGYPGGPIVESYAQKGDVARFAFTVPLAHYPKVAFSFSGLKNGVRLAIESLKTATKESLSEVDRADICASFQKTAVAHLLQQTERFLRDSSCKDFAIVGGASANLCLRQAIAQLLEKTQRKLKVAPLEFCSDNAAMIGRVAIESYLKGEFTPPQAIKVLARTLAVF